MNYSLIQKKLNFKYCLDFLKREKIQSIEVNVGDLLIGGTNPIRLQSMTTTDTMDTDGSVNQAIRMINAGCELVRLTAPSKNEAENLGVIRKKLKELGYTTPLVADIHFTPNAAEIAAKLVEKVRVNPGNYADKKKFETIEYTDETYNDELKRIEVKFTPLVLLCKEFGTAMRIGTNHGSLSDRILSRYGDTPEGMVESAYEFIRICEKHNYNQLVISMKASNTIVMVQAYRLLSAKMLENNCYYPIHLGVTEAGDGEDGRIKSAVGIGALLEDGIGDTIRVSLTEEPEFEIPVARILAEKYLIHTNEKVLPSSDWSKLPYNPFNHQRRETHNLGNIGGKHVPIVVADLSDRTEVKAANFYGFGYNYSVPLDKWSLQEQSADYVFIGDNQIDFEIPGMLGVICSYTNWKANYSSKVGFYPIVSFEDDLSILSASQVYFLTIKDEIIDYNKIKLHPNAVLVISTDYSNQIHIYRDFYMNFAINKIDNPVILLQNSSIIEEDKFQLYHSSELGSMLIDGFGDGIWIKSSLPQTFINSTCFGILQATRTRISKTEYISCPSCGRTLFDLQETTGKIRKVTSHLKGLKIGIMGCIVNGPGEMADADYGYVGTGPGKINLYKEKEVVRKNISAESAVEELINLIKENGDWQEPTI